MPYTIQLAAIGPYNPAIQDLMDEPETFRPEHAGRKVVITITNTRTTRASAALAKALAVDIDDAPSFFLGNAVSVDPMLLEEAYDAGMEGSPRVVAATIDQLKKQGFEFFIQQV